MPYITIQSPKDIFSTNVSGQILSLLKQGYRAKEIKLITSFIASDEANIEILNNFRIVKQNIYHNHDKK